MTKQEIFKEIDDCLDHGDIPSFNEQIDQLFSHFGEKDAVVAFSEYLYQRFTAFQADKMAHLMQEVIHKYPSAAQNYHPENPIFKLTCITGSIDLFDCYIEESVLPYLKDKDDDFKFDYYAELYEIADKLNDTIFSQYKTCIKGLHFNSSFRQGDNPNQLSINIEDYQTMDAIVENFNSIVGRRDILKKLGNKVSEN